MEKRIVLNFPAENAQNPVIYDIVKKFDVVPNILKANVKADQGGRMVVELVANENEIKAAIDYIESCGIEVSAIGSKISWNSELCTDCGTCTSSCLSGALTIKSPDWKLQFNPDKCVACKLCLKACPLHLFSMDVSV